MAHKADKHLAKADPVMRRLIKAHGPYKLDAEHKLHPYQSLIRAIAHQQLHGKAAQTILSRFFALFPNSKFPKPEEILAMPHTKLRGVGFSEAKVLAIRDIAQKTIDGIVPTSRAIQKMQNAEIIERLTQIRGVGQWTVEMLLIFKLGREDVLPAGDFGVRNGYRIAYSKRQMPTPKALLKHGKSWEPYGTAAAWYLWRAADAGKAAKAKPKSKAKK